MKNKLSNEQLQAIVDHLTTHVPKAGLLVQGKVYPASGLVKLAQSMLAARSATMLVKAKLKESRDQTAAVEASNAPVLSTVRLMLGPMLGNSSPALEALAVTPRKAKRTLTTQEKMVSAEKARATRIARGTQSKKQKALVKGNVTGIVVTTVTTADPVTTTTTGSAVSPATSSTVSATSAPVGPVAAPVVAAPSTPVPPAAPASVAGAAGAPLVTGY